MIKDLRLFIAADLIACSLKYNPLYFYFYFRYIYRQRFLKNHKTICQDIQNHENIYSNYNNNINSHNLNICHKFLRYILVITTSALIVNIRPKKPGF